MSWGIIWSSRGNIGIKGREYEIIGVARHSETQEELVMYRALDGEGRL